MVNKMLNISLINHSAKIRIIFVTGAFHYQKFMTPEQQSPFIGTFKDLLNKFKVFQMLSASDNLQSANSHALLSHR